MTTALIILTLNEVDGFKEIMPHVKREWVDELIVIDGGSTDGTIEEAKKMGFNVIVQKRKGHGAAITLGVESTKSDNIVIFGPDGNHEPEEIPQLIRKVQEGYDQVIVSRFAKGSVNLDAGIMDTFGNKLFAFLTNLFFGGDLTDVLNESRLITRKAMAEIKFDAIGLNSTLQMTIRGLKKRQKIFEIVGNEGKRIGGKRKVRSFQTGCLLVKMIVKELIFWNF